ncbi:hypothetical protein GBA52_018207 [Prunus armeniaca]|nr:hypothetical protein GBA52_018207 [Prunus armeniaca]
MSKIGTLCFNTNIEIIVNSSKHGCKPFSTLSSSSCNGHRYIRGCSSSGICPQDTTINKSKSGHLDFELWHTVFVLSFSNSE